MSTVTTTTGEKTHRKLKLIELIIGHLTSYTT